MAAPQGPTTPNTSAIVDGTGIDAADVLTPINELAAAVDEARQTVAVSGADTTLKWLSEALAAGDGITITILNSGGNEQIEISAPVVTVARVISTTFTVAATRGWVVNGWVRIDDGGVLVIEDEAEVLIT